MKRSAEGNRTRPLKKNVLNESGDIRLSFQQTGDGTRFRKPSAVQEVVVSQQARSAKDPFVVQQQFSKTSYLETQYDCRQDPSRIFPMNIRADKERLYSQLLELKKLHHGLEDENMQLRTQLSMHSNDKVKLLSQLSDYDVYHPLGAGINPTSSKNNSGMVIALRNELFLQREEKNKLLKEINQLKKSSKVTKLKEMEVENKQLLDQLSKANQDREELAEALYDYNTKKQEVDVLGSKVIEQDEQISLLRQELREVKQETQEIQSNLEKRAEEYERAIAALQKQCSSLLNRQKKKNDQLQSLTELYSKMRRQNYTPQSAQQPEKLSASKDKVIQNQHQQILQLKQQLAMLQSKKQLSNRQQTIPLSVRRICQFVRLKIRAHHIERVQFKDFLCPQQLIGPSGKMKRDSLMEVLASDPFEIGSLSDKLQLCEFLTNWQEEVDPAIISKRLSDAIGEYTVDSTEDEDRMFVDICNVVSNRTDQLGQALLARCNGQGTISKQNLLPILEQFSFTPRQQQFVLTQISLDSPSLDMLSYYSIFDLFNQQVPENNAINSINAVEELSEEYDPSNSNTNLKQTRTINAGESSDEAIPIHPPIKRSSAKNNPHLC